MSVVVDADISYQTITGFGGYGGQRRTWKPGPYAEAHFVDRMAGDLGVSMLREEIPTSFEPVNDAADPFVTDLSGFNLDRRLEGHHDPLAPRLAYMRAMRDAGVGTFLASVWSPPGWMKHNGALDNGTDRNSAPAYDRTPDEDSNQLRRDHFEEFAEMCAAYVRIVERQTGIRLDAISLQNEPRFSQSYPSAVYDGEALRDLVRTVGRRLESEGLATRIVLPEDVGRPESVRALTQPTLDDPETRRFIRAIAVHGYARDGIEAASSEAETWRELASWSERYGLPLWVTETSGFAPGWDGALDLATAMHAALSHGNASVWLWWRLGSDGPGREALVRSAGTQPTARYHAARQFFRFIRPSAVRVAASSNDPEVLAIAFAHDERDERTVVLIHLGDEPKSVQIQGLPDRLLAHHRTSAGEHGAALGRFPASAHVALPARSITTLVTPADPGAQGTR